MVRVATAFDGNAIYRPYGSGIFSSFKQGKV